MAHFARIEQGLVVQVIVIPDEQENNGQNFLSDGLGLLGEWIQTSYNTHGGVHFDGGQPLRKNYAGIGFSYDPDRDAFIPPKPFESWVLNEGSCLWETPIPYPNDGNLYVWNEAMVSWVLISDPV
jgi:hypothetical protein